MGEESIFNNPFLLVSVILRLNVRHMLMEIVSGPLNPSIHQASLIADGWQAEKGDRPNGLHQL